MNIWLQHCMPQHVLSRLMGALANCRCRMLKNWAIRRFIDAYGVNMAESAVEDYREFEHFNAFFTRALKHGVRDLTAASHVVISPVDGALSEFGDIKKDLLLQAKGQQYSLQALLGSQKDAADFEDGSFMTLYLSPKDYHRVHMPYGGRLVSTRYIPGKLFSVNPQAVNGIPGLFARNERVICLYETVFGPMAVIMVGAMIVASMHLQWCGQVAPSRGHRVIDTDYTNQDIKLKRGDEMGHFQLGSTVIMLFPKGAVKFEHDLSCVQLGVPLGVVEDQMRTKN